MKVYVASSWRSPHHEKVVATLRGKGFDVYDYREDGFSWYAVDTSWKKWTTPQYLRVLYQPEAVEHFHKDLDAIVGCDALVLVMHPGLSAGIELGLAAGLGKLTVVYVPKLREADLMIKVADFITDDLESVVRRLQGEEEGC